MGEIFIEGDERQNLSAISIKHSDRRDRDEIGKGMTEIPKECEIVLNPERRPSKRSLVPSKRNDTQGSMKDSFLDTVQKMEDNEKLFTDQLKSIKDELRETRTQRDQYKKRYEEAMTLQDGKKTELLVMLKQAFEKLLTEIQVNGKAKDYVKMILKILDYNDADISKIINPKEKKGGFLGLFGKK
jgi:hypothetical protein